MSLSSTIKRALISSIQDLPFFLLTYEVLNYWLIAIHLFYLKSNLSFPALSNIGYYWNLTVCDWIICPLCNTKYHDHTQCFAESDKTQKNPEIEMYDPTFRWISVSVWLPCGQQRKQWQRRSWWSTIVR